jgi:hypothetical protein
LNKLLSNGKGDTLLLRKKNNVVIATLFYLVKNDKAQAKQWTISTMPIALRIFQHRGFKIVETLN